MSSAGQICVAGAGVLGLTSALILARRGADVLLLDPRGAGRNASEVAAGLLAPISEPIFDALAAQHAALLTAAYALWPSFAESTGTAFAKNGTLIPAGLIAAARRLGAAVSNRSPLGLIQEAQVCNPAAALAALQAKFLSAGGRFEARGLSPQDWQESDLVVMATGPHKAQWVAAVPELRHLTPVKGQIAVLPHGPVDGPTLRWPGGYLAPQPSGARVGATMETGISDTRVEPLVIRRLVDQARRHAPDLDTSGAYGEAGVRMQTPDGLPLIGPSASPKAMLAVGARRNGWLLAPLVASVIAAYCMGEDPGPWAALLHPGRFK